jgi:hypothetical protein
MITRGGEVLASKSRQRGRKAVHNWKVVLYNHLDGKRVSAGGFDALRAWQWFTYLHGWWSGRLWDFETVRLELWRGARLVLALTIKGMGCVFLYWPHGVIVFRAAKALVLR